MSLEDTRYFGEATEFNLRNTEWKEKLAVAFQASILECQVIESHSSSGSKDTYSFRTYGKPIKPEVEKVLRKDIEMFLKQHSKSIDYLQVMVPYPNRSLY